MRQNKFFIRQVMSFLLMVVLIVTGVHYTPKSVKAASMGEIITDTYVLQTEKEENLKTLFDDIVTENGTIYKNYVRYGAAAVESTSLTNAKEVGGNVLDNDINTRWSSNAGDECYLIIDLGANYSIKKIDISWEMANAQKYELQYSKDGKNFSDSSTVVDLTKGGTETIYNTARIDRLTLKNEASARYIKLQVRERCYAPSRPNNLHSGVTVWEIGIYGSDDTKSIGTGTLPVKPAKMDLNGNITESGENDYNLTIKAPINDKISLSCTGITVKDAQNSDVSATVTDNLYLVKESGEKLKVDYLKLIQNSLDGKINYEVQAYDKDDNKLDGLYYLVIDNGDNDVVAKININAIKVTTKMNNDGTVENHFGDRTSSNTFSYMGTGKVGDKIDLKELTGFEEFYYGDDLNNLTECTQVQIVKSENQYVLQPLDAKGKTVAQSVWIAYDHFYSFDVLLKNIVDEHSEDNGDVYLWQGTDYYITNNEPAAGETPDGTKSEIDSSLTTVTTKSVNVTGRLGDSFISSELGELLIYAATGEKRNPNINWINLMKHPSDGGQRYCQGYCINNYLKLNSFTDKINYLKIYKNNDGKIMLGGVLPDKNIYDLSDMDLYTTRGSVVKQQLSWTREKVVYHVQLRVPSNVMTEKDGKLYSGRFTLIGGTGVVSYNGEVLNKNQTFKNSNPDALDQQESNTLENWTQNITAFIEESTGNFVVNPDLFDPDKINITITYKVWGTLTAEGSNETIEYTQESPLEVTETLSREKLMQSFYACPNLRGYDIMLDLTTALKLDIEKTDDTTSKVSVTKIWDDASDYHQLRPNQVTVTLERSEDGTTWNTFTGNTVTITGDSTKSIWTEELTGIQTTFTDSDGNVTPYQFRIQENSETGADEYTAAYDGLVVTNKLELENETELTVKKIWLDKDKKPLTEGIPGSIDYYIYQDGKYYATGTLSEENNWSETLKNLPVYKNATDKYTYTCCELDGNRDKIETGGTANFGYKYYETEIENVSNGINQINITNVYRPLCKVTVAKKVKSTFLEKYLEEDLTDNKQNFSFTLKLTKEGVPINAISYGEGILKGKNSGEYTFHLSNNTEVWLEVLDGYTITVKEDETNSEYDISWEVDSAGRNTGNNAVIDEIDADKTITFHNENTYYGDVEVQGFQMNTDTNGVAQYSPSFRVISRACKELKGSDGELHNVVNYGTIYSLDQNVNDDYDKNLRIDMSNDRINGEDPDDTETFNSNIYHFQATGVEQGTYSSWTTRSIEDPYYNYYALTFVMKAYSYSWLESEMAFRAYAVIQYDDGHKEYVYGTKIYKVSLYEIAENLYQNRKMGTLEGHQFLYTNVLNLVTMNKHRTDICLAMMLALDVQSLDDPNYIMANQINYDINNYVYCKNGYSYLERKYMELTPKGLTEAEQNTLLNNLNAASNTSEKSLFDWIYHQTSNYGYGGTTYQGFYKIVPYEWDDDTNIHEGEIIDRNL